MMTPNPGTEVHGASTGVFRKARRTRFIHDILGQIEQAIIDGKYRVGDKLPSERELCELFQTSRGPLREALRVLEQKGLITIKAGAYGGAFITAVTTEQMSESLGFLLKFKGVTLAEACGISCLPRRRHGGAGRPARPENRYRAPQGSHR